MVASAIFEVTALSITQVSVGSLAPVGFGYATDRDMRAVDNPILTRGQKLETDNTPGSFSNRFTSGL
jgi:hypothetical protein